MIFRFALGDKAMPDYIILKETQKIKYMVTNITFSLLRPKKIEQALVCFV